MSEITGKSAAREMRLLKFIASQTNGCKAIMCEGEIMRLERADARILKIPSALFRQALSAGQLYTDKTSNPAGETRYFLSDAGKARLKRLLHPEDSFRAQHSSHLPKSAKQPSNRTPTSSGKPRVNPSESPLARLRVSNGKSGGSTLGDHELEAGERLRRDFEMAGLTPNITSNWSLGAVSGNSRNGPDQGPISDMAIDARARLHRALDAVGPELSGIALDVCCFLKGLEQVERERQWPRRSARLMLKTALSVLARHYGYTVSAISRPGKIKASHSKDYRPSIDGQQGS